MTIKWNLHRRVVIRNLDKPASKHEITRLFERCGKIKKLWVARNPPGFALLEYESRHCAKAAVRELNGKHCCGCIISVDLSTSTPDSSQPDSSGNTNRLRRRSRHKEQDTNRLTSRTHERTHKKTTCTQGNSRTRPSSHRCTRQQHLETVVESCRERRKREEQRLNCFICFCNTLLRKPTVTPCGHVFCGSCIKKSLQQKAMCPICETVTLGEQLKQIHVNP